jgi:hypothetical protein
MGKWIPCGDRVVVGDVLQWAEKVWKEKGRGKRKRVALAGARAVTAQVLKDDGRLLTLKVIKCEILESVWIPLKPLKAGETIKRKRETIATKGLGHRTRWSEEGARDMVVSSFLKGKE